MSPLPDTGMTHPRSMPRPASSSRNTRLKVSLVHTLAELDAIRSEIGRLRRRLPTEPKP